MTQPPRRRAPRPAAGPLNESRAAGAPTPPSAAASAPRPGPMYDPGDSRMHGPGNPLEAAAQARQARPDPIDAEREARAREFSRLVAAGAVQPLNEHHTVDASVAIQELIDDGEIELTDVEQLRADIERIRGLKRTHGGATQKLALPKRAGYHTHWFNDEGGRIDDAVANGWSHRLDREKRPLRRAVGTGRDKGVLYAFAMDLPELFWLEDMEARHEVAAARMDALKAAPFMAQKGQAKPSDRGKFYDPTETGSPLSIEKSNPTSHV